ncbi:MAG: amidohydrolase family protein [Novosphingobium sp.]|nr:amidohydrolase family protein [Novosphingobium sp.]
MLIRNAEVCGQGRTDVRIADGRIDELGTLTAALGEPVIDAAGGALLPGLHDHHIHLPALAARRGSVWCGPPEVTDSAALTAALALPGDGWIRGIGYHESVIGVPDAAELDRIVPNRPLRLQHRSGRMWLLNSRALDTLLAAAPPDGLERTNGRYTGRLFDADDWLRQALGSAPPPLDGVSAELAASGITGLTEMSPRNDPAMAEYFTAEIERGALVQHCLLAGTLALAGASPGPWRLGPAKLHLHEAELPPLDDAIAFAAAAHRQSRAVAIHCVTEVELVFALAVLETAGVRRGDRIEHASVASDALVAQLKALGLAVVAQPHFVAERGDQYLAEVEPRHHPELYRLRAFRDAGVPLAAGSDAPFGSADPWAAMRAAVSRLTRGGAVIGSDEALTPEQALALFLADPEDLTRQRRIELGAPADVCLLDVPWAEAREALSAVHVRATIVAGRLVHDRVHQPPVERPAR